MFRKINAAGPLGILLFASLIFAVSFAISYGWARRNYASVQSAALLTPLSSDKDRDALSGPVNRVRTETARLSIKSGRLIEGTRELLESTTYDAHGKRIDNSYFLVSTNSQVGKEEYAYDDKGNVREMTLRDDNNNILSKEIYSYEYDAIGNWVKMITSAVVYEGGKMTQQPTEVTYRQISYYYDQAIAEIVKPDSPANTVALTDEQRAQEEIASLRVVLEEWVAATNARDLEKLMQFYSSKVDAFYHARNVSQDFVRADRARMFQRADAIEVTAGEPEININRDDGTATMRFRKTYITKVDGRERRGEVIQQLQWERTAEGWKIVSERDVKVRAKSERRTVGGSAVSGEQ
jgi:YD repeat-containing protein